MIAGALSFARRAGDIGAISSIAWPSGASGHAERVCRWLGLMLARDRRSATERTCSGTTGSRVIAYRAVVLATVPAHTIAARAPRWAERIFAGC